MSPSTRADKARARLAKLLDLRDALREEAEFIRTAPQVGSSGRRAVALCRRIARVDNRILDAEFEISEA